MSKIVFLAGHNYQRSDELLATIEDTIRMRINYLLRHEKPVSDVITADVLRNLIEGLSALSLGSKKSIFSLLKTMVILCHREGNAILSSDARLLTQFVALLCDFELSVGKELH